MESVKVINSWNEWHRNIIRQYHLQKCKQIGIGFNEFRQTCLAHVRNELYSGTPASKILVGEVSMGSEFSEDLTK